MHTRGTETQEKWCWVTSRPVTLVEKSTNTRVYGEQKNREMVKHVLQYSPKVKVFCAVSHTRVYRPFFFARTQWLAGIYLNMFREWLLPQLQEDKAKFIFIQDGAPPHGHMEVWNYLDQNLPQCRIGHLTDQNMTLKRCPPRSSDLTPCDFFLAGDTSKTEFLFPHFV